MKIIESCPHALNAMTSLNIARTAVNHIMLTFRPKQSSTYYLKLHNAATARLAKTDCKILLRVLNRQVCLCLCVLTAAVQVQSVQVHGVRLSSTAWVSNRCLAGGVLSFDPIALLSSNLIAHAAAGAAKIVFPMNMTSTWLYLTARNEYFMRPPPRATDSRERLQTIRLI